MAVSEADGAGLPAAGAAPRFRLFGGVVAEGPGGVVTLRRRRERVLLGVLLLEPGRPVTAARLVELLWQEPPARALRTVHSHVARLRGALRSAGMADAGVHLSANQGGYVLRVPPDSVDVHQFRDLVARAKVESGPQPRLELLTAAFDLWTGQVFGADADDQLRQRLCAELAELRLVAAEEHAATLVALRRFPAAAVRLASLVDAHPTRERLVGLHLVALYQDGRKQEALAAYERTQAVLAATFGVDPAVPLRRLHAAILRDEPVPEEPDTDHPPVAAAAAPRPDVPAQLPIDIATFTGRAGDIHRLRELLTAADPPPVAISGPGGIGKSALSIHVAHQLAAQFPDGQLYLDLHGANPDTAPLDPLAALSRLLRSLTVDASAIPADVPEASALLRTLTSHRRLLILLDNAADATQVRPLLPDSPTCAVLITSRRALDTLDTAARHELGVLPETDATALLRSIVGDERIDAEPAAAAEMTRLCGGLPLALGIAAARLADRPTIPVRMLVERFASEHRRLRELAVDDQAVRTSFQVSYADAVADPGGAGAARMFRLLGLLESTDIGPPAAAALAGVTTATAETQLDSLVDLRLVETRTPGRYHTHDLLHLFARELAHEHEDATEQAAAVHRAIDYYLATALSAARASNPLDPWRVELIGYQPAADSTPIQSPAQATTWLQTEYDNLLAAARQAATSAAPHLAVGIAVAAHMPLELRAQWREQLALGTVALTAANHTGDPRHHGVIHHDLGWARFALGDPATALTHFATAATHFRSAALPIGEALTSHGRGATLRAQERYAESLDSLERAQQIYAALGIAHKEAACLTGIGLTYQRLGRYTEAIDAHRRSVTAARASGGSHGEVMMLGNLAEAHRLAGDPATAITHFEEALTRGAATNNTDTYWEAEHRWGLGRALADSGDPTRARHSWRRSAAILLDLGLITAQQRHDIDTNPTPETPEVISRHL